MTWFVLTGALLAGQGAAFATIGGRAQSRGAGALALIASILFVAGMAMVYGGGSALR
jgi:hypothetical protein